VKERVRAARQRTGAVRIGKEFFDFIVQCRKGNLPEFDRLTRQIRQYQLLAAHDKPLCQNAFSVFHGRLLTLGFPNFFDQTSGATVMNKGNGNNFSAALPNEITTGNLIWSIVTALGQDIRG